MLGMFLLFFPRKLIEDVIIPETNKKIGGIL